MFSAGGGGDLAGSDLLTCGDCNTKFPLQELVAYIQHKATNCTKQEAEVSTGEAAPVSVYLTEVHAHTACRRDTLPGLARPPHAGEAGGSLHKVLRE